MALAIHGASEVRIDRGLQTHLAALLRLENAGFLLDAGASVSANHNVFNWMPAPEYLNPTPALTEAV